MATLVIKHMADRGNRVAEGTGTEDPKRDPRPQTGRIGLIASRGLAPRLSLTIWGKPDANKRYRKLSLVRRQGVSFDAPGSSHGCMLSITPAAEYLCMCVCVCESL